ncbi:MAG: hypothetical protein ACRD0O_19045, partial [Acidimicrobiia bacterium]
MTGRVLAAAVVLSLSAGACGGSLEENYRRNQPTRGSGPAGTQGPEGDGEASVGRRAVRFFRARSEAAPPAD